MEKDKIEYTRINPKEVVEQLRVQYLEEQMNPIKRNYKFDEVPSLCYNLFASERYTSLTLLQKESVIKELLSPFKLMV